MASRAFTGLLAAEPSQDLLRARDALENLGDDVQALIRAASQEQLAAGWQEELQARPGYNDQQRRIVGAGASVLAYNGGLAVGTGGQGKLGTLTREFEFGSLNRDQFTTYTRKSKKGGTHKVTRRTSRQMPSRSQTGWVAYPAAGRWSSRAFSMFLQIVVKTSHDAIDGGL
jgi:hypothetical protein